ncbi:hypothetical protein BFJ69_g4077 [Fusarium oxysporum]|uniref:Uncharacterized protein n=1 Tax=Fusarium oxysporum TaxID=5507 RepID=A0A420NKT9_FUSOX|nr:hypothetical protein BFJ69_g4077 [Fusarium oxysporum]
MSSLFVFVCACIKGPLRSFVSSTSSSPTLQLSTLNHITSSQDFFITTTPTNPKPPIKMTQSKDQKIAETQANLPLPDQPPKASDWQSADARTVNVGAGKQEGPIGTDSAAQSGLREPATKGEEVDLSNVGREGVEKRQQ